MLYIKNGIIRDRSRIVVINGDFQIINPTDEMVIADGWEVYTPVPVEAEPTIDDQLKDLLLEQYNAKTDLTDEEVLKRPLLVYSWDHYIGKNLVIGQVVSWEDKLWRVRQNLTSVRGTDAPNTATASLYEVIEVEAAGTINDPIEYNENLEVFSGKYYISDGVVYLCTRDSGTPLYRPISELIGSYFSELSDSSNSETENDPEQPVETPEQTPSTVEEGTIDNPIAYSIGTPLVADKYYTQNNVKYLCIRAVPNTAFDLSVYATQQFVSIVE